MYVLAINGSPNKNGNTAFLIDTLFGMLEEKGIKTKRINMQEVMGRLKNPFCTACAEGCDAHCYSGTELEETFEQMKKADFIVFGSPVYFGGPTAQLKALFDKSRKIRKEKTLVGKPAAVITVGASKYGGQETTMRSIHDMLLVEGMTVVGDGSVISDAGHFGVLAQKPAESDEYALNRCRVLAERILSLA